MRSVPRRLGAMQKRSEKPGNLLPRHPAELHHSDIEVVSDVGHKIGCEFSKNTFSDESSPTQAQAAQVGGALLSWRLHCGEYCQIMPPPRKGVPSPPHVSVVP